MKSHQDNPFEVRTPEALSAEKVAELFVDVFSDFRKVDDQSHTFIQGPRGTGKSMMLRYMEPDVQIAAKKAASISDLRFFALHIPIKKAWSDITEWDLLEGSMYQYLAEHLMVSHIAYCFFKSLEKLTNISKLRNETLSYLNDLIIGCGGKELNFESIESLNNITSYFQKEFNQTKSFVKRLMFNKPENLAYDGGLLSYLDFLVPLLEHMKGEKWGCNGPFYLMIDDADMLDVGMQRILNTWVSCRTIDTVCLKVATQNRYSTYRTLDGKLIESAHDYSEVNVAELYTRKDNRYAKRIQQIVERRLKLAGIHVSAKEFFPEDSKQKDEITKIKTKLKAQHDDGKGKGTRPSDDVVRYSVPIYMSSLAGKSRSSSSFSYAGFKNMVDLSSGVIRWFIDPAAKMFSELVTTSSVIERKAFSSDGTVKYIPVSIQDHVIREWSHSFMDHDLRKVDDRGGHNGEESNYQQLHNLLNGLGQLFRQRLLDPEATERKVLSIIISNPEGVSLNLSRILELAVDLGYLQYSSHGSKEGAGRKPKYTLSHRLAPYFQLDPSGYAYNLSVTPGDLEIALGSPKAFVKKRTSSNSPNDNDMQQVSLDI